MPRIWIQACFIVATVLAIYQFAPQASFMPIDDGNLIFKNPVVTEADILGAFQSYDPELYIPLTLLTYQLEYSLVGETPMLYHLTNILLHIANAILVLLVLRCVVSRWTVAFLAALLFAVHPIHTEAVVWVSSRKDLLCAFFYLSSLLTYCRYRISSKHLLFYASVLLFFLALLSKVLAATLPLVLMLIDDMIPSKHTKHESLSKWAYYIPALTFLFIGVCAKSLGIRVLGVTDSVLLAIKSVYFYLETLLLPVGLNIFYPQLSPIAWYRPDFLFAAGILLALGTITIASRQFGKLFAFGILWFGITVLPNLGNVTKGLSNTPYFASDRYAYLPSIGILLLVSIGIHWALDHAPTKQIRRASYVLVALLVLVLSVATHRYAMQWLVPRQYFAQVTARYPKAPIGHALAGMIALQEDDTEAAVQSLQTATNLYSDFFEAKTNLGLALLKQEQLDAGMQVLLEVINDHPDYAYAHAYLAFGYIQTGQLQSAEQAVRTALNLEPTSAVAYQLLGNIEQSRGQTTLAKEYFETAIELDPRSVQAKAALARLLRHSTKLAK